MIDPGTIGLPHKFKTFREGQADTALDIGESGKRFSILSAPTGTGKSLIYMSVVQLLEARTLVLVGTKGLQSQLIRDFESVGMYKIMGQSNYACLEMSGQTCDKGPCHMGDNCSYRFVGCYYYDAQSRASRSDIVVTNYAYWISAARFSNPHLIGKFDLIVMDEAHGAADWLGDLCTVYIDLEDIRDLFDIKPPDIKVTSVSRWVLWATGLLPTVREKFARLLSKYGTRSLAVHEAAEAERRLKSLSEIGASRTEWVGSKTKDGVKFSPVWAHEFAEPYLFRGVPKIVLSSATLPKSSVKYLGIDPQEVGSFSVPSTFQPERRPFTFVPTIKVDRNMTEGDKRVWVHRIDKIIEPRKDRKGIIHTRSYKRAREIFNRSKFQHLMLINNSNNTRAIVRQFKNATYPCILVSPSIEEGFDFPDDECRWQIVAKIPFIDSRDPVTKARSKSDKGYLNHVAGLSLMQMVGRGMRSSQDWCETFIVDDHWKWFKRKVSFPKWFKKAWRSGGNVSKPLCF